MRSLNINQRNCSISSAAGLPGTRLLVSAFLPRLTNAQKLHRKIWVHGLLHHAPTFLLVEGHLFVRDLPKDGFDLVLRHCLSRSWGSSSPNRSIFDYRPNICTNKEIIKSLLSDLVKPYGVFGEGKPRRDRPHRHGLKLEPRASRLQT